MKRDEERNGEMNRSKSVETQNLSGFFSLRLLGGNLVILRLGLLYRGVPAKHQRSFSLQRSEMDEPSCRSEVQSVRLSLKSCMTAANESVSMRWNEKKRRTESRVLVRFLGERVQLSNGVIESELGELTSTVGALSSRISRRNEKNRGKKTDVENLVVEDGEVEGESQSDGVSRREFSRSDRRSGLVCIWKIESVDGFR